MPSCPSSANPHATQTEDSMQLLGGESVRVGYGLKPLPSSHSTPPAMKPHLSVARTFTTVLCLLARLTAAQQLSTSATQSPTPSPIVVVRAASPVALPAHVNIAIYRIDYFSAPSRRASVLLTECVVSVLIGLTFT